MRQEGARNETMSGCLLVWLVEVRLDVAAVNERWSRN
jgi:hypothetical protein